ncbi:MAG: hypothetical protein H6633_12685 [Anaerolineales bacterium]|nr:hypothetical protein [Anaerolineales bacterium]
MELDKRDKFLFHLYDKLWDSIERSETGVWQFIGFNAALFGIIVLVLPKTTGRCGWYIWHDYCFLGDECIYKFRVVV